MSVTKPFITLGIESSCDETGIGLYHSEKGLIGHQLFSQVEIHAEYGGVVPELASRDHIQRTLPLIKDVLAEAKLTLSDISGIAYTAGPGLAGALLVGSAVAKSLGRAFISAFIRRSTAKLSICCFASVRWPHHVG